MFKYWIIFLNVFPALFQPLKKNAIDYYFKKQIKKTYKHRVLLYIVIGIAVFYVESIYFDTSLFWHWNNAVRFRV